ncbi:TPA: hypothetical protein QCX32_001351 [Bacillus toyonensis]|nr:hypothetical protein [Bacillus toyonensis]
MNYSKFANLSPETIVKDKKLSKELYEYCMNRVEVLERVKAILLFPSEEVASTQQVAWFYKVDKKIVYKVVHRHLDELSCDGYTSVFFSRRAILRMGMLLDDNEIANEVMTQLLKN